MNGKITHTEGSIQDLLHSKYGQTVRYKVPNAYVFKADWESDYFILQKGSGYCYEIEIKVSKADFKSDSKKTHKHQILREGKYDHTRYTYLYDPITKLNIRDENGNAIKDYVTTTHTHTFRPNKFYYCVPEGLIKVEDVPDYAGLMYVEDSGYIKTVKEAKFLHKEKLNFDKILCAKFYYYWMDARSKYRDYKHSYDELYKKYIELKKELKQHKDEN